MVHKVLFWTGFGETIAHDTLVTVLMRDPGLAVRLWQLGIEMRPFFRRDCLWAYPLYAGVGASFGLWLKGVEDKQVRILAETKARLLEKRRRRAEQGALYQGTPSQKDDESLFASPNFAGRTIGAGQSLSDAAARPA